MKERELTEMQRKAVAAEHLLDNEVFQTMIEEMERALLNNMKLIPPDDPRFTQMGRHLHALGDLQDYIQGYIQDGLSAEAFLAGINQPPALN